MHRSDPDAFEVTTSGPPDLVAPATDVIAALSGLVRPERLARLQGVVHNRLNSVTVVLEDIADPHNVSAIFRTCEAFAVGHLHVLPGINGFHASRNVSRGSDRWLERSFYNDPAQCVGHLHAQGYRVLAASMEGNVRPEELATIDKVAIVFGNEHRGPTEAMRSACDGTFGIPMTGFVESLNVSVAAAITLYTATRGRNGDLDEAEAQALLARYLMLCVRDPERVVAEYLRQK